MSVQTIFFIILAAFLALGLSLIQYYFTKNKIAKRWIVFSVLRFLTYFAILLLLINPKVKQVTYAIEKPSLVLAVDNSSSIKEFKQENIVKNIIAKFKENKELQNRFSIETYRFGESFQNTDSVNFSDQQTNIDQVFTNLKAIYNTKTAPTILISDGNQTYGNDFKFSAARYNQEVFPLVIGDTTSYEDLKISQLNANRYAFLNNKFPVEIFLNYTGKKTINKTFLIKSGSQTLFSEKITFSNKDNAKIITANLPARQIGVKTYQASIQTLENEKNVANNTKKFAVEVIDEKTNVLLLTEILHPDLGALKNAIEHNEQRTVSIKTIADKSIDLSNYQLIILYQPTAKFNVVYKQIKNIGLNTFTITGTNTDYQFLNSNQPYFEKEITNQTENYLAEVNDNYSVFQFNDIGFNNFPPIRDKFGAIKFSGENHTLLYQAINGYKTETPLLATVENNNARHAFLFGENSWQWRAKSFRDQGDFKSYDEFIGKLVQYLASNKEKTRLTTDYESFYNSGEKIVISAQYFDKNYTFDPGAKLTLQLKNIHSQKAQSFPFLLKNQFYEVDLSNLSAGEYEFKIQVENQNVTTSGKFTIIDFDVEKQFMSANTEQLKAITSNQLTFPDAVNQLINKLLKNKNLKPIQKAQTQLTSIIDWYYLLIIIVASLAAEWFLRKYNGLI